MAVFRCAKCDIQKEVGPELAGKTVRCPRCGGMVEVRGPRRVVWALLALGILALVAAGGGYFYLFHFKQSAEPTEATENTEVPDTATVERQAKAKEHETEAAHLAEQQRKLDDDRRRMSEEQRQLETARQAVAKQRQELAAEEASLKEQRERVEAEKIAVARRRPTLTATLEEIDKSPERFQGKFLIVEDVQIQTDRIDKHAELGRPTVGVTSRAGKSYSRVPLNGLVMSTSDKLALDIAKQLPAGLVRVRLCCEIRPWSRKGSDRSYPEVHVYRLEQVNALGQVAQVLEDQ